MFDFQKFCSDYNIDSATTGNSHCSPGWIQVDCPFCSGVPDYHLGVSSTSFAANCWRCGRKSLPEVIKGLIGVSSQEAGRILEKYTTGKKQRKKRRAGLKKQKADKCILPVGTGPLGDRHKKYLIGRGYDPAELEEIWDIRGTGNIGRYKFRIIAPIYLDGELVSYQGRDITDKSGLRYKACAQEDEVIDHKEIVYGLDLLQGDSAVIVEGLFDAWRMGVGTLATFGTSFTLSQALLISRNVKRAFLLFDSERSAQAEAEKMANMLMALNVETEIIEMIKPGIDPGDLSPVEAQAIMKELGF